MFLLVKNSFIDIAVWQGADVFNIWSHRYDPFSEIFKNLTVKVLIDSLVLKHKLCMDN